MLAKMKKFSLVNSQKIFSNWKMLKFCTLFWHIFQKKDLEKIRSFSIRSLIFWIYDPITILWEKRIYDPIQSSKKKDLDPKGSRSNPILQYSGALWPVPTMQFLFRLKSSSFQESWLDPPFLLDIYAVVGPEYFFLLSSMYYYLCADVIYSFKVQLSFNQQDLLTSRHAIQFMGKTEQQPFLEQMSHSSPNCC